MKFLIVDITSTARRKIIDCLDDLGYLNFAEANSEQETLTKLADDDKINFVIIDWDILKSFDPNFVKVIRNSKKPIIVVTNKDNEGVVKAFNTKVINGFIIGPLSPEILEKEIDKILSDPYFKKLLFELSDALYKSKKQHAG